MSGVEMSRIRFRASRVEKAEAAASVDLGREKAEVVKALMLGVDEPRSTPAGEFKALQVLSNAGGLMPPYDPEILIKWYELSAALRPNIDAYATSIDSYGHRFVPAVDLEAEDVDTQVADILYARKMAESGGVEIGPDDFDPTPEEVQAEKARLRILARRERNRLTSFFQGCGGTKSFIRLRRLTRTDLEVTGNAYWEVLRNRANAIARFEHIPSYLTRLLPLSEDAVDVPEFERVTPVDFEEVRTRRKVRRYVELEEATQVATFFKEFGDTRLMSSRSGVFYRTPADMAAAEGDVRPATEIIHFKIDWPNSPYGVPRWVGAYPEVAGSRAASEVNYLYFDNKSVPPLAMLVSGGRLKAGVADRIQNYIEEKLKGRANFNKIMLVEAESDGKTGAQARIELKSLNDVNQKDGLFQGYDERNLDKIGAQFRVPRLLRGDTRDFNRATAEAAMRLTEEQVFGPEREDFDWLINVRLFPAMGIRFWRFQSLTPVTKDPERLGKLIALLAGAGVILPKEGRRLAADVFNADLPDIKEPWASRPIAFTLAGIQTGGSADGSPTAKAGGDRLLEEAKNLLALSERLRSEQEALQERRMKMAREMVGAGEPDMILSIPKDEWDAWILPTRDVA